MKPVLNRVMNTLMNALRTRPRPATVISRLMLGFFVFSLWSGYAQALECEVSLEGDLMCVSLPADSPRAIAIPERQTSVLSVSLLNRSDLSGGALNIENEFEFDSALSAINIAEFESMAATEGAGSVANSMQNRFKFVEQYLKSGPASTGDLRVISAGRPDETR